MRPNLFGSVVITLICCVVSGSAQSPTLRGRVIPSEKPPPKHWGEVQIKVKNLATKKEVEGEQKVTINQDWYHVAPLGAVVDVLFDKACYVPGGLFDIYVKQGDRYLKTVELQKTKACLAAERRQRQVAEARSVVQSSTVSPISGERSSDKARLPHLQTAGVMSFSASVTRMNRKDRDSLPSSNSLKKTLKEEAKLARRGEFFDTFQYNFQVKWIVYADVAELKEVLLQFRNDVQNEDLFKQVGSVAAEDFNDTIIGQFQISEQLDFENIKKVVKDETLSPSVRGSATVAFLNVKPKLSEETVSEMMEYYRQQAYDSSSEIFASSIVAIARNADSNDRFNLYEDIRTSTDEKRVIASIKALAVTQIMEGPETIPGGAQVLADVAENAKDPSVRAAALSALRPFAYRWDEKAIKALVKGAQEDESAEARYRAALSLGAGDLEDVPWVRRVLRSVAKTDPSPFVRRAANLSLSGARWFSRAVRRRF